MSHDTQHARPAGIPPRFVPVYDDDGTIFYWVADCHNDGTLSAEAMKPTTGDSTTRYNLSLNVEEGTLTETREAVLNLLEWWIHQEGHRKGGAGE
ncbi:hypothetical protein [Kocuria rhizophila]|uniref:hypothetical protein n=1 Tax=Kocuria rhizophila TaxID=72000 RepID=UPI00057F16A5|nr:hypothetical protein [Kocuria rhizophila]KIC70598.1 hypothetical protein RK09_00225 [Kocuria rhizophila]